MSRQSVRLSRADSKGATPYNRGVSKLSQKTQRDFRHTWFLREWAEQVGFTQADAQRQLGWSKAKASDVWNGQQYNQSLIDEIAPVLGVRPFELLLNPAEAMAIRRMRDVSPRVVTSQDMPVTIPPRRA